MILTGTITRGLQEATGFMSIPWVTEQIQRKLHFTPVPGTLNLSLTVKSAAAFQRYRRENTALFAVLQPPEAGVCTSYCLKVHFPEHAFKEEAAILYPDVPGYPAEKLELISNRHLMTALSLQTGETLILDLPSP